jgi:hypothetical protein
MDTNYGDGITRFLEVNGERLKKFSDELTELWLVYRIDHCVAGVWSDLI